MPRNYIHDGYSIDATLPAVPGLYEELNFTFRPMLPQDVAEFTREAERGDQLQYRRLIARWIGARVTAWDVNDQNDQAVPVNEASAMRLPPTLQARLFSILVGNEPAPPAKGKSGN